MWMMTPIGFYSVVQHRDRPELVLVRARVRADLEQLLERAGWPPAHRQREIKTTMTADYPYRVIMRRSEWATLALRLAGDIDYPNFKDRVKARQGAARASVYMRVWGALMGLEREDPGCAAEQAGGPLFEPPSSASMLFEPDIDRWLEPAREGGEG